MSKIFLTCREAEALAREILHRCNNEDHDGDPLFRGFSVEESEHEDQQRGEPRVALLSHVHPYAVSSETDAIDEELAKEANQ